MPGRAPRSLRLCLFDACRKHGHRRLDGGVGEVGVANDDCWVTGVEPLQDDAPRARRVEYRLLTEAVRKVEHDVQTGAGAVDASCPSGAGISPTHSLTDSDWLHEVLWEGQPAKANRCHRRDGYTGSPRLPAARMRLRPHLATRRARRKVSAWRATVCPTGGVHCA